MKKFNQKNNNQSIMIKSLCLQLKSNIIKAKSKFKKVNNKKQNKFQIFVKMDKQLFIKMELKMKTNKNQKIY